MKALMVTGPGITDVVEVPRPHVRSRDVLVKIRACGICGSDSFYIAVGGLAPHEGHMPIGHEPAGEVVEVGTDVCGITVGDRVVINPMASRHGVVGNGGSAGALADYLLIDNAQPGVSLEVIPDHIPFEVAALNDPMAVALHAANRCRPGPADKALIFGAGPIGLGAVLAFKSLGADAVINPADEDVAQRLIQLHGCGAATLPGRSDTDIFLDAAGSPAVIEAALAVAKTGATLGVVAVHKTPAATDFMSVMSNELTIVGSMGYPDEIFTVTKDLIAEWEKYALIIGDVVPFDNVDEALAKSFDTGRRR